MQHQINHFVIVLLKCMHNFARPWTTMVEHAGYVTKLTIFAITNTRSFCDQWAVTLRLGMREAVSLLND